jgi:hypothetical protein
MLQILCNEDSTIIPSNNNDTARSRCHNIKSNIISSKVDKEKITEWLASAGKTSEPKLLYRASRDGWSASDFHRMCDGKGATVTVVKSSDGYIFGGYTNVAWEEKGRYKSSAESFLFSLKDKAGIGPSFGSGRVISVLPRMQMQILALTAMLAMRISVQAIPLLPTS